MELSLLYINGYVQSEAYNPLLIDLIFSLIHWNKKSEKSEGLFLKTNYLKNQHLQRNIFEI